MSNSLLPDKSNFLEKYAQVEELLKKKQGVSTAPVETKPTPVQTVNETPVEKIQPNPNVSTTTPAQPIEVKPAEVVQPDPVEPVMSAPVYVCSKCGTAHNQEDRFCGSCGNKLTIN
jgi:hypothetical protein